MIFMIQKGQGASMKGLIRGIKGTLAVTLCALLAVPAVAGGSAELRATSTDGVRLAASASGSPAAEKEETVYVLAHADGSVRQLIVSDWLKNPEGVASLSDYTELTGVKNVKGDESFEESGEHGLIWAAGGHDIYYQGATEKTLPVDVAIRFTLDGKSVTPEELAGQSGHVTMRFDYDNHTEQTVTISGKSVSMAVPFLMLSGTILDNDRFTNIQVTNGKLVNDGSRSVVMGFALPGMQENLGIDKADWEIPDYVEIEADVSSFSLTTTLTLAVGDWAGRLDLSELDELDALKADMQKLDDASAKLLDGSSSLYHGLATLLKKSDELVDGIGRLADGADALVAGITELGGGIGTLQTGAENLQSGLQQLQGNSASLGDGAKTVFETLLSTADQQLAAAGLDLPALTIESYAEVLDKAVAALSDDQVQALAQETAKQQVTAAVEAQRELIVEKVTAAVQQKVLEGVLAAAGNPMTAAQYAQAAAAGQIPAAMQQQIAAGVDAQMQSEAVQAQIAAAVEQQVETAIRENLAGETVKEQIAAAVAKAAAGRQSIRSLREQLDSYRTFYEGLLAYTGGVDAAAAGAGQLVDGAHQLLNGADRLAEGSGELQNGLKTLREGSGALVDGVRQLQTGAMQLRDGMKSFREEGIDKLTSLFDGDLDGLKERLLAMADLSKQYDTFAGKRDETAGSVKFIYRTDAIG